jgi:hypothetical protein
VQRKYDLFGRFQDDSVLWHGQALSLDDARQKLQEIGNQTTNECFAMHLLTKDVVARVNTSAAFALETKPLIFQIAYDETLYVARASVLRSHGFEVVSVIGNEAATILLSEQKRRYHMFIVGHGAPEERRKAMVEWLKTHYPAAKILALNPAQVRELPGADYNAVINGPETWLPFVSNSAAAH